MFGSLAKNLFGSSNDRYVKSLDKIVKQIAAFEPTLQALTDSVRVRTRPIIMTAFGTAVGMVPIAMERAIGLERLSPLAVVSIGGLMLSTFLTLLYVPIFYTIFEDLSGWVKKLFIRSNQ